METEQKIKVGITLGDFNGVGPEVIIKTFLDPQMLDLCTPIIFGSSKIMATHRKTTEASELNFNIINSAAEAHPAKVNLINCWNEDVQVEFGKSSPEAGKYSLISIDAAIKALKEKQVDVIVTAPVNKNNINTPELPFAGHTEYLAQQFEAKEHLMLLVNENLRVGLVTGHVPISEVSKVLNADKIVDKLKLFHQSLVQDFGIRRPKLAVLGLNPHAGDGGLLGKEETDIIKPAIKKATEVGLTVYGPYPADGFFGSGNYKEFDGVLAMYHDQGLAPFKSIAFSSGVNFTAGLSIVRTSPDHGTAYDIAGKNKADERSFREAIYLACDILRNRKDYRVFSANPLKVNKLKKDYG